MNTKQTVSIQLMFLLLLFGLLTPIAAAQPLPSAQTPTSPIGAVDFWTPVASFVQQEVVQHRVVNEAIELFEDTRDLLVLTIEIQCEFYRQ